MIAEIKGPAGADEIDQPRRKVAARQVAVSVSGWPNAPSIQG